MHERFFLSPTSSSQSSVEFLGDWLIMVTFVVQGQVHVRPNKQHDATFAQLSLELASFELSCTQLLSSFGLAHPLIQRLYKFALAGLNELRGVPIKTIFLQRKRKIKWIMILGINGAGHVWQRNNTKLPKANVTLSLATQVTSACNTRGQLMQAHRCLVLRVCSCCSTPI